MSIEINSISKQYGKNHALQDVTLTFEERRIYGLLGRNGAGKSTLLNILSNRIFADTGAVRVDGLNARENDEAQRKIFIMSEQKYYPAKMRVEQLFTWTKSFYPEFDRGYALNTANLFGLDTGKAVRSLSTGYGTILKLIIALSANTPYVFLDEPVLGLDANHRVLFYEVLRERYRKNPCTIVLSTHLIEEAADLLDDVIIIKDGRILCSESKEALLARGYTVSGRAEDVDRFTSGKKVVGVDVMGTRKQAYVIDATRPEATEGLEITAPDLQKLVVQLTMN